MDGGRSPAVIPVEKKEKLPGGCPPEKGKKGVHPPPLLDFNFLKENVLKTGFYEQFSPFRVSWRSLPDRTDV
jgi:hypothetical protein